MTLFGNRNVADVISLDDVMRVGCIHYDWHHYKKKRHIGRDTQGEESHVMMDAKTGVLQLQVKKRQGGISTTRS